MPASYQLVRRKQKRQQEPKKSYDHAKYDGNDIEESEGIEA